MKEIKLKTSHQQTLLSVELTQWYAIDLPRDAWVKADEVSSKNIYSSINFDTKCVTCFVKLCSILSNEGITYYIKANEDRLTIHLASAYGQGTVFVSPVYDEESRYLHFVVNC